VDGHTHEEAGDTERDQMLMRMGYRVLRVTNVDVMNNMEGVICRIAALCSELPERRYSPTPTPPLEGRGF
jgi:very-short-patch-repair endonuclease